MLNFLFFYLGLNTRQHPCIFLEDIIQYRNIFDRRILLYHLNIYLCPYKNVMTYKKHFFEFYNRIKIHFRNHSMIYLNLLNIFRLIVYFLYFQEHRHKNKFPLSHYLINKLTYFYKTKKPLNQIIQIIK